MTKPRKLHQLKGTITYAFLGKVTSKGPHQDQPFYLLTIQQESLFTGKKEASLYAFPNLVSKEIWTTLEQQIFKNQTYLFWCEKRTRGWRLKKWEEIK